jgi:hypothetical protein
MRATILAAPVVTVLVAMMNARCAVLAAMAAWLQALPRGGCSCRCVCLLLHGQAARPLATSWQSF